MTSPLDEDALKSVSATAMLLDKGITTDDCRKIVSAYLACKSPEAISHEYIRSVASDKAYARFPDVKDKTGAVFADLGQSRYGYINGFMDAAGRYYAVDRPENPSGKINFKGMLK